MRSAAVEKTLSIRYLYPSFVRPTPALICFCLLKSHIALRVTTDIVHIPKNYFEDIQAEIGKF